MKASTKILRLVPELESREEIQEIYNALKSRWSNISQIASLQAISKFSVGQQVRGIGKAADISGKIVKINRTTVSVCDSKTQVTWNINPTLLAEYQRIE